MASIIKADDGVASGQTGIVYTADTTGTLELQATSGLVSLQNVTGGMIIPSGTTAQQPASPTNGMIRYNTDTTYTEVYQNGNWTPIATTYNGTSVSTAFRSLADMSNQSSSGTYWIKTSAMATAQQFYVEYSYPQGPWIRIFLATTDNYNTPSYSWPTSDTNNMLINSQYFMYAFCNTSNNSLTYPWAFKFNDSSTLNGSSNSNKAAFLNTPPMGHGGSGAPLITLVDTIRLADNTTYTGYLRTGVSSFGSYCDDSRAGDWGQICLKAGGTGGGGTSNGGYGDFPHYTGFYWSGTDNWARSDQGFNTNTVSSTYRFAIYCKLV